MSQSTTYRRFRRRIGQITRRSRKGPALKPRQLSVEVMGILADLRRAAGAEPEIALELSLGLLETLPDIFSSLDDRLGLLGAAIENVPGLVVELLHDDRDETMPVIDRFDVFERLFWLWISDESGYLHVLEDAILAAATTREDEDVIVTLSRGYLREMPLVFPAPRKHKLDLDRSILLAERYRVERLLGQMFARHQRYDFGILAARGYYRMTDDGVDYVEMLLRAGRDDDALDVARRILRNPAAPRHGAVRSLYDFAVARRDEHKKAIDRSADDFIESPTREGFEALRQAVPSKRWPNYSLELLGRLETSDVAPDLCFQLYLEAGHLLEADGMVRTRPLSPDVLNAAAMRIREDRPDAAAGWWLMAAMRRLETARRSAYVDAADWLEHARGCAEACGERAAFDRAIKDLRERYRRRSALLRILDERGL